MTDDPKAVALIGAYHNIEREIAGYETKIATLRQQQGLLIGQMHQAGLTYRQMEQFLAISKSRVHQREHGK